MSMPTTCTLEEIGQQAFKIIDLRKVRKGVNTIELQAETDNDSDGVNAVFAKGNHPHKGQASSSKGQPQRGGAKEEKFLVCFSHKQFGPNA